MINQEYWEYWENKRKELNDGRPPMPKATSKPNEPVETAGIASRG